MFNLEQSIAEWRRQMLAAGIKPDPLDELENHLREEIERQTILGLNGQKAFYFAICQIGDAKRGWRGGYLSFHFFFRPVINCMDGNVLSYLLAYCGETGQGSVWQR
jgi:hypothetical protein